MFSDQQIQNNLPHDRTLRGKTYNKFPHLHLGVKHEETDVAYKSMDKDFDDQYLMEPLCVTRPLHEIKNIRPEAFYEHSSDGFNNLDRNKNNNILYFTSDEFQLHQAPYSTDEDITERGSNSSANTTSHSALLSSEVMSKDAVRPYR